MNILDTIVTEKQSELAKLPVRPATAEHLKWAIKTFGNRRNFASALRFPTSGNVSLIAEVKKASPSAGVIRADFDPVKIAQTYEKAGASCISVLTDEKFFQGSLEYLRAIREAVKLPLLRKDFIIHERQILESIEAGADAILLIVSILDQERLKRFIVLAAESGIDALVEVHDADELERAVAAGAQIIGVNNRDLKTFKVDLKTTEDLALKLNVLAGTTVPARIPSFRSKLLVAESGIHTRKDVERVVNAGANAILVGESLMREQDIEAKVRELLGT